MAGTTGDVQERYAYSAYGTPRVLTPTFTAQASSNYDIEVLYAGYRYEQVTGVYHIRHRVYHRELGCWVQQDPLEYKSEDFNLYGYVHNSPPNATDAMGQDTFYVCSRAIAAGGGLDAQTARSCNCQHVDVYTDIYGQILCGWGDGIPGGSAPIGCRQEGAGRV